MQCGRGRIAQPWRSSYNGSSLARAVTTDLVLPAWPWRFTRRYPSTGVTRYRADRTTVASGAMRLRSLPQRVYGGPGL